eukprot:NODE_4240_length_824_cov_21.673548_g3507_i0.p1 GENE.NODE_4240_length_824_cov_21.673548_g3507_i0~~NODE_4240_length_824_cov_21.673548_g3507_i0.p1  ORF type:complete len:218 (+),score=14.05 NODE_4240_length_824_cov_21.673548_g3507_i0:75-728(+)
MKTFSHSYEWKPAIPIIATLAFAMVLLLVSVVIGIAGLVAPAWYTVKWSNLVYTFSLRGCHDDAAKPPLNCATPYDTDFTCHRVFIGTLVLVALADLCTLVGFAGGIAGLVRYYRTGRTLHFYLAAIPTGIGCLLLLGAVMGFGGASKAADPLGPGCNDIDQCPTGATCELRAGWYLVLLAFLCDLFACLIGLSVALFMPSASGRTRPKTQASAPRN